MKIENTVWIIIGIILLTPTIVAVITSIPGDNFDWEGEVDVDSLHFIDKYIINISLLGSFFSGIYFIYKGISHIRRSMK